MVIFWNPHSPLFEVGWCVMLYLAVLTMEFSPVILEKYPNIPLLDKIHKFLKKIRIPLVILGIMLSTLHQSSLGSLFLAMPYKLHPLWYTPIVPIIFFASAICLGFMMVMVESMTSSFLYKKEQEENVLSRLKKYTQVMLFFYLVLRIGDIVFRGATDFMFDGTWGAGLFWAEITLSVLIPMVIFSFPVRKLSISILYFGALSGVIGIVFNRLNVGGLTHLNNLSDSASFYFPSLMELSVSAGVVSLAMLTFFFFVENFKVWDETPNTDDSAPKIKPYFDSFRVNLGTSKLINRTKFSLAFVLAFSLTFAMMSGERLKSNGIVNNPVTKARGNDTLLIDGNRDGYLVAFAHKAHQERGVSCGYCHHMNKPDDKATGCYECHSDMYVESDAFRHDWHSSSFGANLSCFECHDKTTSKGLNFNSNTLILYEPCRDCHENMIPPDAKIKKIKTYKTVSYTDAMHNLCISCHEQKIRSNPLIASANPDLSKCSTCHINFEKFQSSKKLFREKRNNKWVVVPISKLN